MQLQVIYNESSWVFRRPLRELNIKKIVKRLPFRIPSIPDQFSLQYEDFDGDMIDVTCDADLQTIQECQVDQKIMKLYVQESQNGFKKEIHQDRRVQRKEYVKKLVNERVMELIPEITKQVKLSMNTDDLQINLQSMTINDKQEEIPVVKHSQIVHEKVMCDGCEMFPIIGIRYKCAICKDFDLCEQCEEKNNHDHAMLKIRKPEQAPSIIFAAIGDKSDLPLGNTVREQLPKMLADLELQSIQSQCIPEELNATIDPVLIELCEMLRVKPEVAQQIYDLFPNCSAHQIYEIIGDDVEYLNSLERSTI